MAVPIEGQGYEIRVGTYGIDIRQPIYDALWILYNYSPAVVRKDLLTQEEYNALQSYEENVAYCIYDPEEPIWSDYWISVIVMDGDEDTDDIYYCKTLLNARARLDETPDVIHRISIGEECGITNIPEDVFYHCDNLKTATFASTVKRVYPRAFSYCSGLTSLDFPADSLEQINYAAFAYSSIHEFTIPDNVIILGDLAFEGCANLYEINFNDGLATIGERAFDHCENLTELDFPDSLGYIQDMAFEYCTGLTEVDCNNVQSIGAGAFRGCTNLRTVNIDNVNVIGAQAFDQSGITRIEFVRLTGAPGVACCRWCNNLTDAIFYPGSQFNISDSMFAYDTNLVNVVLQEYSYFTTIGVGAFQGCTSLPSITIPNSVKYLNRSCFETCTSLSEVVVSDQLIYIYENAFLGCSSLNSMHTNDESVHIGVIKIPDTVTAIGYSAFQNCTSIQSIIFPPNIDTIQNSLCLGCTNLTSISLPAKNDYIGSAIGPSAFRDTALTSVTIPIGYNRIEMYAFGNCRDLQNVVIYASGDSEHPFTINDSPSTMAQLPFDIQNLSYGVFGNCIGLKSITVHGSVVDADGNPWDPKSYHYKDGESYLPEDCVVTIG